MNVKGASLILWVNDAGEVIDAKSAHNETGNPIPDEIKYGPDEIAKNKKFVGGNYKNKIRYPNSCCWVNVPGTGWVCRPCT